MSVAYERRYQRIVDGLMEQGVSRESAEARAREIAPLPDLAAADIGPLGLHLTLPEPPSANRWWRNVDGRMITSKVAREYKRRLAALSGLQVRSGRVRLTLDWYRGRRAGDLDKRIGVLLDALQGVAYTNDSQIVEIIARRFDDPVDPRVEVIVEDAP